MALKRALDIRNKSLLRLLFLVLLMMIFGRSYMEISDWKVTHWLFNYDEEFVKRRLAGETVRLPGIEVNRQNVLVISYVFLLVAFCALTYIFYRPIARDRENTGLWLFFFAVSSPATFQHFIFDAGRLDIFCLLLALASLQAIDRLQGAPVILAVFLLMGLAILIHEAAFFMYVPMVLAYWLYRDPPPGRLYPKLGVLLVCWPSPTSSRPGG